jgi:hypothetical protein
MARFAGRVYDDPMLFALLTVISRERDGLMSSQSACKQQGSSSRSRFPLSGSPSKRLCLFRGQPVPQPYAQLFHSLHAADISCQVGTCVGVVCATSSS